MVDFRGKCASCGKGKKHKNFNGRRSGYHVPQPCYVALRRGRSPKDDRLCKVCHKKHLAKVPAAPPTPSTPVIRRRSSSTSSLDGIRWSETDSERVAKKSRRIGNGEELIPLSLHQKKMDEQAHAFRNEMGTYLNASNRAFVEQEECDDVEAIFLRELSVEQRARLFQSVVDYYKEKPSADRAQLLGALTNDQAFRVAGVSSRTMARARRGPASMEPAGKRRRMTKGGLSMEQVMRIAFEACMDPRFCEVRSWISHSGEFGKRHWECVGLVDIKTMWSKLCEVKGPFASLSTFYKAMPDFYVPKKKERCVCAHCKAGRRALDDIVVVVNAMRRGLPEGNELKERLGLMRGKILTLHGHLDKEIVIDIADGRHQGSTDGCAKCGLLIEVKENLKACCQKFLDFDVAVKISAEDWSVVFPGRELPSEDVARVTSFLEFAPVWEKKVQKLVDHLLLKGDRIRALEADVEALRGDAKTEVWFADYSMPVKLTGTFDETEADFLSKELANNLGFMRMYWHDGEIWKEYWDFVFEGSKDMQATIQIQQQLLAQIAVARRDCGLPELENVKVWADNANDFKGGDIWSQWQKEIQDFEGGKNLKRVEMCYHAPGEGKTPLDGHFGHLKTVRERRERMKKERRTVEDLLKSMVEVEATHVVHVKLDRREESRFYNTAKGIKGFHRVLVEANTLQAQEDSKSPLVDLKLDVVKERKTKRSREVRERQHGRLVHSAQPDECQKCHHQMKKNESLEEWIQCEECVRSWHKTCVGIAADYPTDKVEWARCSRCGGADPEGEMLVKRRKVATCIECGQRLRGLDHSKCQAAMADQSASFRTPVAKLVSKHEHGKILRKKISTAKERRASRKPRRLRKGAGRIISGTEYETLLKHV